MLHVDFSGKNTITRRQLKAATNKQLLCGKEHKREEGDTTFSLRFERHLPSMNRPDIEGRCLDR